MVDDGWGDLEKLAGDAMRSTREFTASTRGGAGSSIERRMADAFIDLAAALVAQAKALEVVSAQQERIERRLDDMERAERSFSRLADNVGRDIKSAARREVRESLSEYGVVMDRLYGRADEVMNALERLDTEATESYRKAVDEGVKRLKSGTAGAIAAMAVFAVLGGILAAIGAFLALQVFLPLQAFVAKNGMATLVVIVVIVSTFAYILLSVITSEKR